MSLGGIIQGASGLIGSVVSGIGRKKREKRQHQYNLELADHTFSKQQQMWEKAWDKETAYNDPKAQMSRLKNAGINPHMAYQAGGVTNTASTGELPQYSQESLDVAPSIGENFGQAIGQGVGMIGQVMQNKKASQEIRKLRSEADLIEAETNVYKNATAPEALAQYAERKWEYERTVFDKEGMEWKSQYTLDRNYKRRDQQATAELKEIGYKTQRLINQGKIEANILDKYINDITVRKGIDPRMSPEYTEMLKQFEKAGIDNPLLTYLIYTLGGSASSILMKRIPGRKAN